MPLLPLFLSFSPTRSKPPEATYDLSPVSDSSERLLLSLPSLPLSMAYISVTKPHQWKPRLFITRASNPPSFNFIQSFSSVDESISAGDQTSTPIPEAPASASLSKLESLTAAEAGAEAEGKANARTLRGKQGVEWDEDLFVVLIDSYGKA